MKFDEKRLGYGVENLLIKKGAKGYFADDYKELREMVEKNSIFHGELIDVQLNLRTPYFHHNYNGIGMKKFFYLVEEAPVLTGVELVELLGTKFRHNETGKVYVLRRVSIEQNEDVRMIALTLRDGRYSDFQVITPAQLHSGYQRV